MQSAAEVGATGQLPEILSHDFNDTVDSISMADTGRADDRMSTVVTSLAGKHYGMG
jgi:hypothetical protein